VISTVLGLMIATIGIDCRGQPRYTMGVPELRTEWDSLSSSRLFAIAEVFFAEEITQGLRPEIIAAGAMDDDGGMEALDHAHHARRRSASSSACCRERAERSRRFCPTWKRIRSTPRNRPGATEGVAGRKRRTM
jgi:hypothetical protein